MSKTFRQNFILFMLAAALFLLSACLRYDHFEPAELNTWGFGSDAAQYWDLSSNLIAGRGFVDKPGSGYQGMFVPNVKFTPDLIRLPGYPTILALSRLVWDAVSVAYALNFLFFFATLFYFNKFLKIFFSLSETARYGLTCIFGLSPLFLIFNQGVQNDTLTCAVVTGATYHLLKVTKFVSHKAPLRRLAHLLTFVIFGSIALLTKVNTLFFIFPLVFLILMRAREAWRYRLEIALASVLLVAVVLIWSLRTYSITGSLRPAIYTGQNLFINFVYFEPDLPESVQAWRGPGRAQFCAAEMARGLTPEKVAVALDHKLTSVTLDYCRSVPLRCGVTAIKRIAGLFLATYFEIADVIFTRIFDFHLVDNHVLDRDSLKNKSKIVYLFYRLVDLGHQIFKWCLLLSTVSISFLGFKMLKNPRVNEVRFESLAMAAMTFVVGTGLLTTVDRLVLPVYPVLFLCALKLGLTLRHNVMTSG